MEGKFKKKTCLINEEKLSEYLIKNKLDYTTGDIISLCEDLKNYYTNRSLGDNKSFYDSLYFNERQIKLLNAPYSTSNNLVFRIYVNNVYNIDMTTLFIEVNPNTGIVDDYSIMCLTNYFSNLRNNITITELYDILRRQNNKGIDYHEIKNYVKRRNDNLYLREIVIYYVTTSLRYSKGDDDICKYRCKLFLDDMKKYYNITNYGSDNKLIKKMTI